MSDVFISHVKEDSAVTLEIARGLEAAGYTTWYYERDSVPGVSYLLTTKRAIEESRAVLVIISADSLASQQMTKEIVRAHESDKPFIPVLRGVTHDEFQQRQPEWREAMGAAASLEIPAAGVPAVVPRIVAGLKALGIHPKSPEERAAEDRARRRAQRLHGLLSQAEQATAAGDWDKAVAALNEYLTLEPGAAAIQARLLETQQRQRKAQLAALRTQAANLARAEKWEEALSAWRRYLALEPEDKEAAQAELQKTEKLRAMARTYAEAQTALAKRDYDRAIALLKGLVIRDESYKQASRLLANAIERKRRGRQPALGRWLPVGLIGAVLIALVLLLLRVLLSRAPGAVETPPSPSATVDSVLGRSPTAKVAIATAVVKVSATRSPTSSPAAPSRTPLAGPPAVTPKQLSSSPTAAAASAATSRSVWVPDAVVGPFFAPGPNPEGLAAVGDSVWVVDGTQRLLYQLDRAGAPRGAFPITFTNSVLDLAWDGEALRLTLDNSPHNPLVVRLDREGRVLDSFLQPVPGREWGILQAWSPTDGSLWELRGDFLLEFDADGKLVQTFDVSVWGSAEAMACGVDGLWVIGVFGDCYRLGFDGETLSLTKLSVGSFPWQPDGMAVDEQGYLWLVLGREIYQIALRQVEVTLQPTPQKGGQLALPRPRIEPASIADRAVVYVTNALGGPMTVSFDGQSAIVSPGDTWSAELAESVYNVFASANVPQPIAFSDRELLLAGYEYTWVLRRPE